MQCGICTPGFIVAAKALLDRNPNPSEHEIRFQLAGNLCRCTGYDKIVRAVQDAAKVMAAGGAAGSAAAAQRQPTKNGPAQPRKRIACRRSRDTKHSLPRRRAMSTPTENNKKYKVIGTRPIRHDGADKVTGRAIYGADVQLTGTGARPASCAARTPTRGSSRSTPRPAEKLPGVFAVVTAADFPDLKDKIADLGEGSVNLAHLGANCWRTARCSTRGTPWRPWPPSTRTWPKRRAKLIKVEYEPLPAVTWVLDAMKRRRAAAARRRAHRTRWARSRDKPSNVATHLQFETGDVDEGLRRRPTSWSSASSERPACTRATSSRTSSTALWNQDGHLTIWTSTQGSFTARQQTAELLQIPVSQVTVVPCEIGGGFGGKIAVYLEPVAAMLSRKCGRPVKMSMKRDEVFEGTGPTPGSFMRVKLGAKKDGTLVAGEAWLAYDAGAFPGGMIGPGCMCVFSCYDIPNARVDGYDVLRQQAQDAGLSGARRHAGRLRLRAGDRRAGREAGHRPDRVPAEERRQGRDPPRRRPGLSAGRPGRNAGSRPGQRALEDAADGPEPRPRHRQPASGSTSA